MSGLCVSFHFWFLKVSPSYSECGRVDFVYTRVLSNLTMWAGGSAFCTRLLFSCSVVSDSLWPHGLQPTRLPFSGSFPSLGWSFTISQSLLKLVSIESVSLYQFNSVQFSRSVVSNSLQPHELQHARPPCPSPTPGVYSNSCPSSRWCHPAISFSVVPFSSCPQSLPASGSFPMSQLFASGVQSIGVSASASSSL